MVEDAVLTRSTPRPLSTGGEPARAISELDPEDALEIARSYEEAKDIKEFRGKIAAAGPAALDELLQQLSSGNLRIKRRSAQVILDRYLEFMKLDIRAREVTARMASKDIMNLHDSSAASGTIRDPMQLSRDEVLKIWRKNRPNGQGVLVRRPE